MNAALGEDERKLAEYLDGATLPIFWVGGDGTVLWANRAFHEQLGAPEPGCGGRPLREIAAEPALADALLERLARGESVRGAPFLFRAAGGAREALIDSETQWRDGRLSHARCFVRERSEDAP